MWIESKNSVEPPLGYASPYYDLIWVMLSLNEDVNLSRISKADKIKIDL